MSVCLCFTSLQHMMVMEDMLKDFQLGEHLLLVGNQVSEIYHRESVGTRVHSARREIGSAHIGPG